jgi:hypothetical protein
MTLAEPFQCKNFRVTSRTGDRTFSSRRVFSATYHPQILTCSYRFSNPVVVDPRPDEWNQSIKNAEFHFFYRSLSHAVANDR